MVRVKGLTLEAGFVKSRCSWSKVEQLKLVITVNPVGDRRYHCVLSKQVEFLVAYYFHNSIRLERMLRSSVRMNMSSPSVPKVSSDGAPYRRRARLWLSLVLAGSNRLRK